MTEFEPLSSLDDLFALNLETYCWQKVHCSLAPLPRKGHSMNIATIRNANGTLGKSVIMFGGFSPETNTLSNTVHEVPVDQVLATLSKYESRRERGEASILEYAAPVTWCTLKTTGVPPPARCRHSACVIEIAGKGSQLWIFGGIVGTHFDTTRPYNDIYMLDLDTHAWVRTLFGPDALSLRTSGWGPPPTFGHVAFPMPTLATVDASGKFTEGRYDMIVFGGSTNSNMASSGCQNSIYRFNTKEHNWQKIPDSMNSPPARYGHCAGILIDFPAGVTTEVSGPSSGEGVHNNNTNLGLGFEQTSVLGSELRGDSSFLPDGRDSCLPKDQEFLAVVFGGSNTQMCSADAWILDLSIRFHSADLAAVSSSLRVKHLGVLSSHHLKKKMVSSASLPLLHPRKTFNLNKATSSSSSVGLNPDDRRQFRADGSFVTPRHRGFDSEIGSTSVEVIAGTTAIVRDTHQATSAQELSKISRDTDDEPTAEDIDNALLNVCWFAVLLFAAEYARCCCCCYFCWCCYIACYGDSCR